MKKINYFKILADKTIKVIGFHGLNRFFMHMYPMTERKYSFLIQKQRIFHVSVFICLTMG